MFKFIANRFSLCFKISIKDFENSFYWIPCFSLVTNVNQVTIEALYFFNFLSIETNIGLWYWPKTKQADISQLGYFIFDVDYKDKKIFYYEKDLPPRGSNAEHFIKKSNKTWRNLWNLF